MEVQFIKELQNLKERIERNDPYLTTFTSPAAKTPFVSILLDRNQVQQNFVQCYQACEFNTHITKVIIDQELPEPELITAITYVSQLVNLQELIIRKNGPSSQSSLPIQTLIKVLREHIMIPSLHRKGITHLEIQAKIYIQNTEQVKALAECLSKLKHLQFLSLRVLPRCDLLRPTIHFDSLLRALPKSIRHVRLYAGYEHNPFQQSLFQNDASLALQLNKLQTLRLDNFALTNTQLVAMASHLRTKSKRQLRSIHITRHSQLLQRETIQAFHELATELNLSKCILLQQQEEQHQRAVAEDDHENLQTLVHLNRIGRAKLLKRPDDRKLWIQAMSKTKRLDAIFTLLQWNPNIIEGAHRDPPKGYNLRPKKRKEPEKEEKAVMFWENL